MLCSDPPKFWGIHILDNVKKNYPQFSNTALILSADFSIFRFSRHSKLAEQIVNS